MKGLSAAVSEAFIAVAARPARTFLVSLGTMLGIAVFVATLGASVTAANQIRTTFNTSLATEVRVAAAPSADPSLLVELDADSAARVLGVQSVGKWASLDLPGLVVSRGWQDYSPVSTQVYAASPGALGVVDPGMRSGATFDSGIDARADRVILLSTALAGQLGLTRTVGDIVFIADVAYTVGGSYDSVAREPQAQLGAIIPWNTAINTYGSGVLGNPQILVSTRPGAASVVARQIDLALMPTDPSALAVEQPVDPSDFFNTVNGDARTLYLAVAAVAIILGGVSIFAASLFSVTQRTTEIGLRRCVGASSRGIGLQFMLEGGIVGAVAGTAGAALGVLVVVAISLLNGWTATLPIVATVCSPVGGMIVGVLAASYASARATRVTPVEALRR